MTTPTQEILREVLGVEARSKHPEVMDNPPTTAMVQATLREGSDLAILIHMDQETLIRTDQVQVPLEVKVVALVEEMTPMDREILIPMAPARPKAKAPKARLVTVLPASCWRRPATCSRMMA